MAQLQQAFDATQWDPSQSVGMLPIGRHKVVIESSEVKANAANTGGYLALTLQVIEGPSAGSSGVLRLNLYSQSQKAVEIAHRELSAICHAVGVFNVQDSAQLHNLPFMVEVGNQKPTQEQETRRANGEEVTLFTEVKKIFDVNGNAPGKKGTSQPAQAPQAAPAPVVPPTAQPAQFAPNVAPASWGEQPPVAGGTPAWAAPAGQPAPTPAPAAQPAQAWQAPAAGGPAPWQAPR